LDETTPGLNVTLTSQVMVYAPTERAEKLLRFSSTLVSSVVMSLNNLKFLSAFSSMNNKFIFLSLFVYCPRALGFLKVVFIIFGTSLSSIA
jgi:hypothetical protein